MGGLFDILTRYYPNKSGIIILIFIPILILFIALIVKANKDLRNKILQKQDEYKFNKMKKKENKK
ncbi:MAG: hypothetical protein J5594_03830 [Elusimicrobiaceae bacterium]|nr:hypothetical protein [Elusimicrobiaceae bacterium]